MKSLSAACHFFFLLFWVVSQEITVQQHCAAPKRENALHICPRLSEAWKVPNCCCCCCCIWPSFFSSPFSVQCLTSQTSLTTRRSASSTTAYLTRLPTPQTSTSLKSLFHTCPTSLHLLISPPTLQILIPPPIWPFVLETPLGLWLTPQMVTATTRIRALDKFYCSQPVSVVSHKNETMSGSCKGEKQDFSPECGLEQSSIFLPIIMICSKWRAWLETQIGWLGYVFTKSALNNRSIKI